MRRAKPSTVPLAVLLTAAACEESPVSETDDSGDNEPSMPTWEGERVVFRTERLDDVCAGTLAWLDATVDSIEAELQLEPSDEKIEFLLVDDETVEDLCDAAAACVLGGTVYSSPSGFKYARHELVHARLRQLGPPGKTFFEEGIAAALDKDGGCLASSCADLDLDQLLLATKSSDLPDYSPGADLVHGLLTTHGPAAVLAFMAELTSNMPPDEVRSIYIGYFGSVLDGDYYAYMRTAFDEFTIAQQGCDSLVAAEVTDDGISLQTAMDCSSPDVVNDPLKASRGVVTRSFVVTPETSGEFSLTWAPEAPPQGPYLKIEMCRPSAFAFYELYDTGPYELMWIPFKEPTVPLAPGQYRLSWTAEFNAQVEFQMRPSCMFEFGGCSAGQQCTIWNQCVPQVDIPASLGDPCEQSPDGPLVCEAGSRCLGGVCVAECDATQPCAAGQTCSRTRVCGDVCDLLGQDCEPGFACMPTGDDNELNASGLGACVAAGQQTYGTSCDHRRSDCEAGLSCELGVGACYNDGVGPGCCVPYCDAAAEQPGCPAEHQSCDPIRDGPVGTCR